jgi:hypothetical protein
MDSVLTVRMAESGTALICEWAPDGDSRMAHITPDVKKRVMALLAGYKPTQQ